MAHPYRTNPERQCDGGPYRGLGGIFCIKCGHLFRELGSEEMQTPFGELMARLYAKRASELRDARNDPNDPDAAMLDRLAVNP